MVGVFALAPRGVRRSLGRPVYERRGYGGLEGERGIGDVWWAG